MYLLMFSCANNGHEVCMVLCHEHDVKIGECGRDGVDPWGPFAFLGLVDHSFCAAANEKQFRAGAHALEVGASGLQCSGSLA
jgi:hypothetical protein